MTSKGVWFACCFWGTECNLWDRRRRGAFTECAWWLGFLQKSFTNKGELRENNTCPYHADLWGGGEQAKVIYSFPTLALAKEAHAPLTCQSLLRAEPHSCLLSWQPQHPFDLSQYSQGSAASVLGNFNSRVKQNFTLCIKELLSM